MFSHPEKNITQAYVGEGMVVADFGSGSGHHAIAAARAVGKYGKVYAIDVQIDLLHKIKKDAERQGLDNVDILHADLEQERGSGLADHSVDRVFIFNTLFFSEVRSTIVGEAFRILRSKGRLAIIDWSHESEVNIGPKKDQRISKSETITLAKSAGFLFEKEFDAGDHHYGLLFTVPKHP